MLSSPERSRKPASRRNRRRSMIGRYRDLTLVALLLVVPPALYFSQTRASGVSRHWADDAMALVTAPISWLVVTSSRAIDGVWGDYVSLVDVRQENHHLASENQRLRRALVALDEVQSENVRLRRLLGRRDDLGASESLVAHVVAASSSTLYRSVRLDRGRRHGVRVGAAVITDAGVVGRVGSVSHAFSDVILAVDPNSSIDILVRRTRTWGRIRGAGASGQLGVDYLRRTEDVQPGDLLVTSGRGGVFPRGIPAGHVRLVEKGAFGLYQRVEAEPLVEFSRLETVLIVTPSPEENAAETVPVAALPSEPQP